MRTRTAAVVYAILVAVIVICFSTGVSGSFLFDDISNIVNVPALHLQEMTLSGLREAALSGQSGLFRRPVSVVTFALNYYFAGQLDPYWFKWTNIFIHILNCTLVFFLVDHISRIHASNNSSGFHPDSKKIALIVTAVWALHPLHVSTVLYIVQRMTLLSATFSLLSMLFYLKARISLNQGKSRYLAYLGLLVVSLMLGVLSKENAALSMLYIFCLEWFLFRFTAHGRSIEKRFLIGFFGLGLFLPGAVIVMYTLVSPDWLLEAYAIREFTMTERLMTQGRMLWHYVQWILIPNISFYAMHHDDIALSLGLLDPATTLFAWLGLGAVVTGCLVYWRKLGLIAFGVFFFFAGHVMESTIIGLELVFEHRNYLPSLGLVLAVCVAFSRLLKMVPEDSRAFTASLVVVASVLALSFATYVRSDKWEDPYYSSAVDVQNHPESARSHHTFAVNSMVYTDPSDNYERINRSFLRAAELDPSGIGGLYGKILLDISTQKVVDENLIAEFEQRLLTNPFRAETVHFINDLIIKCEVNDCSPYFADEDLRRLLSAARENPKFMAARPVDIILLWVRYLITHEGNIEEAYSLLRQGIEINPDNPAINSYLLEIYALGKTEEEKQELIEMVRQSEFGIQHPSFVERLESRVSSE
jgi:tetratricopeptide (TPR) repeat protein